MTPLANLMTMENVNKRYEKKKNKVTEEKMIKWVTEDIIRYLLKRTNSRIDILICTYANEEHFWSDCKLTSTAPYYLKRKKTKMAFYKYNKTLELQEKIIDKLKKSKLIHVVEEVEAFSDWKRIENYKKTVTIKYKTK